MTTSTAVTRGAALLDEHLPGWDAKLDLTRLDLAAGDACVLGQLYGDYSTGTYKLDVVGAEYGFFPNERPFSDYLVHANKLYVTDCPALTDAWRDLVQQRRLARAKTAAAS